MHQINVMIADDHPILRKGMLALFEDFSNIKVVGEAGNGQELLTLMASYPTDVVLLDLDMPIMDGQECLLEIKKKYPNVKVIIVSQHFDPALLAYYKEKGACAYVPKGSVEEIIIDAVESVTDKGCYFDNFIEDVVILPTPDARRFLLTKKEIQVIKLFCAGLSLEEIAHELGVAISTADYHMKNIHVKTQIKKAPILALFAVRTGIISGHNRPFLDRLD